MKIVKGIINWLQWVLLTLSLIALTFSFLEGLKYQFGFDSEGFQFYLSLYSPYSLLFGAAFLVLTTNLAIERLALLTESNLATFKIGNRPVWIENANLLLKEIEEYDPKMAKTIRRNLVDIYDVLFEANYKLESKKALEDFFNKFFRDNVKLFEKNNLEHIKSGGVYRDKDYNYSYRSFRYIFAYLVRMNESYSGLTTDLEDLYQVEVFKLSINNIDKDSFRAARSLPPK